MVYQSNFIATIKVGGKILRENKDVVALPFGSEYSIYLKNQNSVRAVVRVSIDGQPLSDVSDGWIIIGANDTLDLERFIHNGNFNKGNRFKFIERTAQIEEHKGIGVEDGLVRVEYKFEVPQPQMSWGSYVTYGNNCGSLQGGQTFRNASSVNYTVTTTTPTPTPTPTYTTSSATSESVGFRSVSSTPQSFMKSSYNTAATDVLRSSTQGQSSRSIPQQQMCVNMASMDYMEPLNDAGITVAGSESNQKFSWGSYFPTETTSHVIVLKLVGKVGDSVPVSRPITVQVKPTCSICGKVNKATNKFCGRCGTALHLL